MANGTLDIVTRHAPHKDIYDDNMMSPAGLPDFTGSIELAAPVASMTSCPEGPPSPFSIHAATPSWLRRQRTNLVVGATVASTAITMAVNPLGETLKIIEHEVPAVTAGMAVMEAAWIGGAAMMLSAIGQPSYKPKHPKERLKYIAGLGKDTSAFHASFWSNPIRSTLQMKLHMTELAERANDSKLFQAGFWVNTGGAVGEFFIPAVAVCSKLPVESWGILGISAADLAVTIGVRKAIRMGLKKNTTPKTNTLRIASA